MKSTKWVVLIVIAVFIGMGAWFFLRPPAEKGPALAEMLPADTLIALELINLEKSINQFKTSRLGQKLKETDIRAVMQALGTHTDQIEKVNIKMEAILSFINSPIFKELFGRNTIIALLPFDIQPGQMIEARIISSLVFVSRTKHRAGVLEIVSIFMPDRMQPRTHQIEGYEVQSLNLGQGITVYYIMVDGLMISTFDPETMKTCLELKTHNPASLVNNPHYQNLSARLLTNASTVFFFNNTKRLYENLIQNMTPLVDKEDKTLNEATESFKGLEGFDAMAFSSYGNGNDMRRGKGLLLFDKNRMTPLYAKMYGIAPEKNKTLGMTPKNAIIYYWANSLDLKTLKKFYFEKLSLDETTLDDLETQFMTHTGVGLDESIAAFGNQGSFLVTDIKTGGAFPIPVMGFMLQTKDQDTADKLLSALVQKTRMGLETEQVDGMAIKYMTLPFGTDLQPAYAFYNDFCVVATNRQLLKEIIHVDKNGQGIANSQAFKEVGKGLPHKSNGITFLKTDVLLGKIQFIAEWGKNMAGMAGPQAVEQSTVVLNNLVTPLLDGLKMYKTIYTHTEIRENEMEVTSCVKIEKAEFN